MRATARSINHDSETKTRHYLPEADLLIAVLDRAVLDYHGKQPGLKRMAEDWLFDLSANEDDRLFSFRWVCLNLELDPVLTARAIKRLQLCRNAALIEGTSVKIPRTRWVRKKVRALDTSRRKLAVTKNSRQKSLKSAS